MSVSDITLDQSPQEAPDESEVKYRQLFDHLIHGFAIQEIICDEHGKPCDFRILEVNRRWEEITGAKAEDVVGKTVRETFPGVEDYWIEALGNVALTGEPARLESSALGPKGIRLQESPEGGVVVQVGLKRYATVEDVADDEIRGAIRAAIAEWESKFTPRL